MLESTRIRDRGRNDGLSAAYYYPPGSAVPYKFVTVADYNCETGNQSNWADPLSGGGLDSRFGQEIDCYYRFADVLQAVGYLLMEVGSMEGAAAAEISIWGIKTAFTPVAGAAIGALTLEAWTPMQADLTCAGAAPSAFAFQPDGLTAGPYYGIKLRLNGGAYGAAPNLVWAVGL